MPNRVFLAALLVAGAVAGGSAEALTFGDGKVYTITQPVDGGVSVFNSGAPLSEPTTVVLAHGAEISSVVGCVVHDSSVLKLAGGSITSSGLRGLRANDQSKIVVESGAIHVTSIGSGVQLTDSSTGEFVGGMISATHSLGKGLDISDEVVATIRGGTIRGTDTAIIAVGNAQLHVFGGLIGDMDGGNDLVISRAQAHFYGSGFMLDGQPTGEAIAGKFNMSGRLTGTLKNGDPLDIGLFFVTAATVYLHAIPEPSTLGMLVAAIPSVKLRSIRRYSRR